MKMKKWLQLVSVVLCLAVFAGCGSGNSSDYDFAASEAQAPAAADYGFSTGGGYYEEAASGTSSAANASSEYEQKIIMNYDYYLETTDFDGSVGLLEAKIAEYGGYIENMSLSGSKPYRYSSYTIRIPAAKVEAFLKETGDMGTVYSCSSSQTDITSSYYDVQAHIEALNTQHKRLLELMAEATEIEDIILLEERLSNIEYELGSYESQMKVYDNKVNYATVYMSLDEVSVATVQRQDTFGEKIGKGLKNTFENIAEDAANFAVWFIVNLPYIVIWIIVIFVVVKIIGKLRRRNKKTKKEKKPRKGIFKKKETEPVISEEISEKDEE